MHAAYRTIFGTRYAKLTKEKEIRQGDVAQLRGQLGEKEIKALHFSKELKSDMYRDVEKKHREMNVSITITEQAASDLNAYYQALDRAVMQFHGDKMREINSSIRELWTKVYQGSDIDTIEINADEDKAKSTAEFDITKRKNYQYRVQMVQGDIKLDMRGRCSAGQKVLASIIIRMALAENFCAECGIFTLDEPTTNLDEENIKALANSLGLLIQERTRARDRNFQLVIITHDETFVEMLGQKGISDVYWRVSKIQRESNSPFCSCIKKQSVADLTEEIAQRQASGE